MDMSKLAELGERLKVGGAQMGERLRTGGAQMGRIVGEKMKEMKEILQTPTPESKIVDEATSETLEEPNWGLNLRICTMINNENVNGSEIVRAIKKKISGKSVVSQRLSLDLLEVCSTNCEKVFSEVASEKVLDEMVKMIEDPQTDQENRVRALQLIRAWGESEDLAYLPVFHQTYMALKERELSNSNLRGDSPPFGQYSLESYIHEQPLSPPERYPIPNTGLEDPDHGNFQLNYRSLSVEEKKKFLSITRNSLELLSSILNSETEPKPLKEDLTLSMLEKCKESQPVVKGIIESTTDDEGMLFEALYLHDELQQAISKYEELEEASQNSEEHEPGNLEVAKNEEPAAARKPGADQHESSEVVEQKELEAAQSRGNLVEKSDSQRMECTQVGNNSKESKPSDFLKEESGNHIS